MTRLSQVTDRARSADRRYAIRMPENSPDLRIGVFCYTENMIKIVGNDIMRSGKKIGWFEGNDIRDHENRKLGYFESNDIHNAEGRKVAYLENGYLYAHDGGTKLPFEKINKEVVGGVLSEIEKCAIYILLD
jgi:hypothetical protein